MFVTDTHPLLWYTAKNYRKLSAVVKDIFDRTVVERTCAIFIPSVVLWEVSLNIKAARDSIELNVPFPEFLDRLFAIPTLIEEPVTRQIISRSHDLEFHTDPFDTLIVATALEKELPLITNDSHLHKTKPCDLVW